MEPLKRIPSLTEVQTDSIFLWGARQTGKSTLLKMLFPKAVYYDLLRSDEFTRILLFTFSVVMSYIVAAVEKTADTIFDIIIL